MSLRPAKTQSSLGIHPIWSDSSLCAQWVAKDQAFFMRTAKTLIRLRGCPGWSESLLGAHAILLFRLDQEFALKLRRTPKPSNDSSLDSSISYENLVRYSLKSWPWLAAVACAVRWPISNAIVNDIWLTCFARMCNWNYWHKHRALWLS